MRNQNHTSQKGITLIALIITIIVMLILVGVTISVALNGGLFAKGEKAAFQTAASTVKEQLEIEKASRTMDNDGKKLEDYSIIKIGDLAGLDKKTKEEFGNKLVVNKNGDICYNPEEVTDEEEKTWLEEIGINANINNSEGEEDEPDEITGKAYGSNENNCIIVTDNGRLVVIAGAQILKEWEYEIYEGDLKNHQEYASIASSVDYSAYNKFAITNEFGYFYAFSNYDNTLSICYLNPAPGVFSAHLQLNDSININSILSEL